MKRLVIALFICLTLLLGVSTSLLPVGVHATAPAPMAVISRGAPAYTNDTCGGSYPAANGDDSDYTTLWWQCNSVPSASNPKWLAYDLSSVPVSERGMVVLAWYNDPMTSEYDHKVDGGVGYNNVGAYTIDVNPAPGGAIPTSGWVTLISVSGNTYSSRQHLLDMTGYQWVRLFATASDGSTGNRDVAINMDVQDASAGATDDLIFLGDSITQDGLPHDTRVTSSGATVGTYAQLVHAQDAAAFPVYQDGGIGGLLSADGASHISAWLALFPGTYVTLNYGTNDAMASPGDPSIVQPFHDHMQAMVQAVLAAGKVPIIPTIPYGKTSSLKTNVPILNNQIALLERQYPQVLPGPDLYTYFKNNPTLISTDGIHPKWNAGYAAYRQLWATWAISAIYAA